MMKVHTACFILSFIVQCVVLVDYNLFSKVEEFSDLLCPIDSPLDFGLQKKATRCAAMCSKSTACKGFFYNNLDKFCNGTQQAIANSEGCQMTPGTSYYQNTEASNIPSTTSSTTTSQPSTTISATTTTTATSPITTSSSIVYGSTCSLNSHCFISAGTCLDNVCSCEAGYRYQSSTDSCVAECVNLGSTYITYVGKKLSGENVINTYDGKTITFCKDTCTASSTCLGFNYRASANKCVLRNVSPLTHPNEYTDYGDIDYFSRNCE